MLVLTEMESSTSPGLFHVSDKLLFFRSCAPTPIFPSFPWIVICNR